ncbi:MAG TPA: hypothetical protein VG889_05180, partial [Rhizomicrobium sp.]|nr:hypothetical protein [Rhizomicrobium sp.]
MVAFVTGTGLGLERSSAFVIGSRGQLGSQAFARYGENVYVNAATGNLVIERTDEVLIGEGPDDVLNRTYNSLGTNGDDNGDNWQMSAVRRIGPVPPDLNTNGSAVTRYDWDGSDETYTYDTTRGCYVCTQGAGAYDTLKYDTTDPNHPQWIWTDGDTQIKECYDPSNNGRIVSRADPDTNQLTYGYTGNLLTSVTTTVSGKQTAEVTTLVYDANNRLQSILTSLNGGATLTRTYYNYDQQNRLRKVTTDLTPGDNSVADNNVDTVIYDYDSVSGMVSRITQNDGAKVEFTYTLVGGVYRIQTVKQTNDAAGTTSTTTLSYDTGARVTTITDQQGNVSKLFYNLDGSLKRMDLGIVGSTVTSSYRYTYTPTGDIQSYKDANGNTTTYTYDTNGNLATKADALGNSTEYTYSIYNELLTETLHAASGTSQTTRYAYDTEHHLRFVVSALGEVTEYQYYNNLKKLNGDGTAKSDLLYRSGTYDISALADNVSISEASLMTWADAHRDSTVMRMDYSYDFRGNVTQTNRYGACTATGDGDTSQAFTRTNYVYDQYGNLLSRTIVGETGESWAYDGLGRVVSHNTKHGTTLLTTYTDSSNQVAVQLEGGLLETSVYDLAGRLVGVTRSGPAIASTTTTYAYDNLGRLVGVQDPDGNKSFYVYDLMGRKTADIAADGSVTEYGYDDNDNLLFSVAYEAKIAPTTLAGLSGDIDLNSVRPGASDGDLWSWRIYDADERLVETIDGKGNAVAYQYDGASHLVRTTAYATPVNGLSGFKTSPPETTHIPATSSDDRVARNFYDADGRLVATLDGMGYLTETVYDQAGETASTTAYYNQTNAGLRVNGSLADLKNGLAAPTQDRVSYELHDGRGLLVYQLDSVLHPTAYIRDGLGNVINKIEYAGRIATPASGLSLDYVKSQIGSGLTGLSGLADNRSSWSVYDTLGRLAYAIDPVGTVTKYFYDDADRITKRITFANPCGAANMTLNGLNNWSSATAQATDTDNRATWYFRDVKGRVVYEANARGYVTKYKYDADDNVTRKYQYAGIYAIGDATTMTWLDANIPDPAPADAEVVHFTYDPDGRVSDSYDALGTCTHFDYDGTGKLVAKTLAYGTNKAAATLYAYDAAGNLLTEQDPSGVLTTFTYNAFHQAVKKVVSAATLSVETDYAYDTDGRLTDETDAAGNATDQTRTHYDYTAYGVGDRTDAADDNAYKTVTHYEYDSLGRMTSQTRGSGNQLQQSKTTYSYNFFGEVYEQTDAANNLAIATVTRSLYYANGLLKSRLRAANGTAQEQSTTFYTYTAFGEQLDVTHGLGSGVDTVTHHEYDQLGRLVLQTEAANGTAQERSTTTYAYDAFGNLTDRTDGANSTTANTTTHFVYDLANRLVQEWGAWTKPEQSETLYAYDALNRLTDKTLAANVPADASNTHYDYDGVSARVRLETRAQGDGAESTTYYQYDALGRNIFRTDGYNDSSIATVTRYDYDSFGRVIREYRGYQKSEESDTQYKYDHLGRLTDRIVAVNDGLQAVRTHYDYDLLGRVTLQTDDADGAPILTQFKYDTLGRLTDRYDAQGSTDQAHTHYDYDRASRLTAQTDADGITITSYLYDALDEVTEKDVGDASGTLNTTTYEYDRRGDMTGQTRKIATGSTTRTTYGYDAIGNVILTTLDQGTPLATKTYAFYDRLNRKVLEVDAESFATKTAYTARGDVARVTRYAQRATGSFVAGDQTTVNIVTTAGEDATTTFTYDGLSHVKSAQDAMLKTEYYDYDALGRRVRVTNRLGGTTESAYDHLGRLTQTTQDIVYRNSTDTTDQTMQIVTGYQYDLRGNRTQMVEGNGTRTTIYKYDGHDRMTETWHDAVTVMDQSDFTTGTWTPKEYFTYDKRGNLVEKDDAAGGRTLFYYDGANRKIAQVDAMAGLTYWTYDAAGNVKSVRAYDTALTGGIPGTPDGPLPAPNNGDTYRETTYLYDGLNRLTSTTVANVLTGSVNGAHYAWTTAGITVSQTYRGGTDNVWRQTDGNGNYSYFWYDLLGRKVAQLDQNGYVTAYALDADGNVTTETRYANAYSGAIQPNTPPVPDPNSHDDRVTVFEYDRDGRRITETRQAVQYVTLDADHKPVIHSDGASVVRYEYNELGEVTKKTEATGDYTIYAYDNQGRQTIVKETPIADYRSTNVQHLTDQYYDALGDLSQSIERGDGTGTAPDRVTAYTYVHGQLSTMTDPDTNVTTYYYDKAGRTVLTSYVRKNSAGANPVNEGRAQRYDALGRAIWQSVLTKNGAGSWNNPGDIAETVYNAHGDVVERHIDGKIEETNVYDGAGRLVKSNAGDGVIKLYVNDGNGNRTAMITSSGAAPAGYTWTGIDAQTAINLLVASGSGNNTLDTGAVTGMAVTVYTYDARNQKTGTWQTLRQLDGTANRKTLTTSTLYNAFGEVVREIDARQALTTYDYNTMGKMVARHDPQADYTDDRGTIHSNISQKTSYGYDLSGRMIAVTDANQNATTRVLLANTGYGGEDASVLLEYHPDGGTAQSKYDVFGDLRESYNEIGDKTTYAYDKMSRLLQEGHYDGAATLKLTDYYVYDSLGQRVQHHNSKYTNAANYEYTDYDAQGRVTRTTDMDGYVTGYGYQWNATLSAGLGTSGGWIKTTTIAAQADNGANRTLVESSEYYGRMTTKVDYGGHTFTFSYNAAGGLAQRITTGETVSFTYYDTGLAASQASAAVGTTTYTYDENGNRLTERLVKSGDTLQNMTVTYDAMNRMLTLGDPVSSGDTDPVTIAWEYDAVGNVRHTYATYYMPGNSGGTAGGTQYTQDYWYLYDTMNRVTVNEGQLYSGRGSSIWRGRQEDGDSAKAGMSIAYDAAGNRRSVITTIHYTEVIEGGHQIQYSVDTTESYAYVAGYLSEVDICDPHIQAAAYAAATYGRDEMGRVTDYA